MSSQISLNSLVEEAQRLTGSQQNAIRDSIVKSIYSTAENIASNTVSSKIERKTNWDRKIDNVLTSPVWGFPIMFGLLALVFWVTITGANIPSAMLAEGLFWIEARLTDFFLALDAPSWLHGFLVLGFTGAWPGLYR